MRCATPRSTNHESLIAFSMSAPVKRFHRERRQAERLTVRGDVEARLVSDVKLFVLDISRSGFAARSPIDFEAGFSYEFRFASRYGASFRVHATNVHCLHVVDDGTPTYVAGFLFAADMAA